MLEKLGFVTGAITFLKESACTPSGIESIRTPKDPMIILNVNLFHLPYYMG